MNDEAYRKLIVRYANGRKICNCGEAYYTNGACKNGCSANLIDAKYEIAELASRELFNSQHKKSKNRKQIRR